MIKGPDRITSDGVGGNLAIAGGRNRGASAGGSIIFQTSPAAAPGVAGTLATALSLFADKTATFGGNVVIPNGNGTEIFFTGVAGTNITSDDSLNFLGASGSFVGFGVSGTGAVARINATGLIFVTDNTFDIGATGATRARDLFLARNVVAGGSSHAFGIGAPDATIGVKFLPSVTSAAGSATGMQVGGSFTATVNGDSFSGMNLVTSLNKGAFTGLTFHGIRLFGSNMSASGAGTVGNSAVLYIGDAPTLATNNFSFWVDNGTSRFDGNINTGANLLISATAPTIGSGFGTSPSIVVSNGTAAFIVDVGTGGTANSGVITMPAATTGYVCDVENRTGVLGNVANQRTVQIATTTTSITVENQTVSTGAVAAWAAGDDLAISCVAY